MPAQPHIIQGTSWTLDGSPALDQILEPELSEHEQRERHRKPLWLMLPLALFRVHGARLGPYNWRVFAYVFGYCHAYSGECWPSIATIAKDCRMSPRQVAMSLHQLERDGLLEIIPRPRPGKIHLSNVYRTTEMVEHQAIPFRQVRTNAAEALKPIEFAFLTAVLACHDDRNGTAAVTIRQAAYLGGISVRSAYVRKRSDPPAEPGYLERLVELGYLGQDGNGKLLVSDLVLYEGGIPHADLPRQTLEPSAQSAPGAPPLAHDVHFCKSAPGAPDRESIPSTSSSFLNGKGLKKETERKARRARFDPSGQPVFSDLFERFWEAYPKKVEAKKRFAWQAWERAGLDGDCAARDALRDYLDDMRRSGDWSREGGRFIPNAEALLDRGLWRNTSPATNEHGCFVRPRRVTTQEALAALGLEVGNG